MKISDEHDREGIAEFVAAVNAENVDYCESLAAKEYFSYYHMVRFLRLTEKQYNNIYMVTGEADYQIIRKK